MGIQASAVRTVLLVLLLVVPTRAPLAAARDPRPRQTPVSPSLSPAEAERAFSTLLQRYFEAYVRKDVEGMAAVWHPGGPARFRRNVVVVEFELRDVALAELVVRNAAADPGGGRARAIVHLKITDAKTRASRNETRVRDFTFLPDESGAWKIWNEASPGMQLARRLLDAAPADREALLAAEPELASDDALIGLGIEASRLQGQGKLDDVLSVLSLQSRLARMVGDQDALGTSLVRSGSLQMMMGHSDEAAQSFAAAREAFAAAGNRAEVAAADGNLANLLYTRGQFAEAADRYRQAVDTAEQLNDDTRMGSLLHGLGNALYMQMEFARALEQYERALPIVERTRDTRAQASLLQAIALVHKEVGEYDLAIDALRQSLALSRTSGDAGVEAKAWAGLGEMYRLQGDLARALEHHLRSLVLFDQAKNAANRATENFAIGRIYAIQRSFTRAIEFYQKALDLDRSNTDDAAASDAGQARDLGGLGGAHFAQGRAEVALGEFQQGLALFEKVKDDAGIIWTLIHIGVVQASQSRRDEAVAAYGRSLDLARGRGESNAVSTALALRASVELARGDADAALASATEAAGIASSIEHLDTFAYARVVCGKAHRKAGHLDQARAAFEEAASSLSKAPLGPGAETFFDDRRGPYLAMVDLLVGQDKGAEAFQWSERGRQRLLADLLGGDGAAIVKGLTAAERDEERLAVRNARSVAVKIQRELGRQQPDQQRLAALRAEGDKLGADRDTLRQRLFDVHPALRTQRAQGEAAGVESACAVLSGPRAALLSFVVGEDHTWAFAIARDSRAGECALRQAVTIDVKAADLDQKVRQFREAIGKRDDEALALAKELHALLIAPLQSVLAQKTKLVVVPDALLWSLPFEALESSSGRFLVEDAAISYAPSVTAFAAQASARRDPAAGRSLVALGDPVLGKAVEERLALMRPAAGTPPATGAREVQNVALLFDPARRTTYLREQARVERLAQGVGAGAVLHLALPLLLSEASPLYSVIALTPTDSADANTGLVEIAQTMDMSLPADVAVFSRLEYGPGAGSGEALTALSWSMFVGGAPTIVVNRWLPDEKGPSVVTRFFRASLAPRAARAARPSASELLQGVMKSVAAQPVTRHPYYWAGFLAIGR